MQNPVRKIGGMAAATVCLFGLAPAVISQVLPQTEGSSSSDLTCNTLILADRNAEEKYIGNIDSMKYHKGCCEYARVMNPRRRIIFDSKSKAQMAGMNPCNWCMPAWTLKVEGKIIRHKTACDSPTPDKPGEQLNVRQDDLTPGTSGHDR